MSFWSPSLIVFWLRNGFGNIHWNVYFSGFKSWRPGTSNKHIFIIHCWRTCFSCMPKSFKKSFKITCFDVLWLWRHEPQLGTLQVYLDLVSVQYRPINLEIPPPDWDGHRLSLNVLLNFSERFPGFHSGRFSGLKIGSNMMIQQTTHLIWITVYNIYLHLYDIYMV